MSGHRNCKVLFDANVFIKIAKAESLDENSDEIEKIIREYHYVIKSQRLLKHYIGAIHHNLMIPAGPLIRNIIDKLENRRPKLTKKINDQLSHRHDIGFQVHSDDHFLYQLAIEAKRRSDVLFVSNDPSQLRNNALMVTNHDIPIIDSIQYINEYC